MQVTKRDIGVLAAFTLLVVAFASGAIYVRSRPPKADLITGAEQKSALSGLAADDEDLTQLQQFATIAERDMFRPLTLELASLASLPGKPKETPSQPRAGSSREQRPTPRRDERYGRSGGIGPRPEPPGSTSGQEEQKITIALTGIVHDRGGLQALVEDGNGSSQFVRIGTEAFGYTLRYLSARGGVFERAGRYFILVLGQNKLSSSKPSSGGSSYHVEMHDNE